MIELPENTLCARCGYSIHGVTSGRCPECGEAFELNELTHVARPRWPLLLGLLMAASAVSEIPWFVGFTSFLISRGMSSDLGMRSIAESCAMRLLVLVPSVVVAYGLFRSREWARKLTLVWTCLQMAIAVGGAILIIQQLGEVASSVPAEPLRRLRADAGLYLAPRLFIDLPYSAAVFAYLVTGIRRISLIRDRSQVPPVLVQSALAPRRDWLWLVLIQFALFAAHAAYALVYSLVVGASQYGAIRYFWLQRVLSEVVIGRDVAVLAAVIAGTAWLWGRPKHILGVTLVVAMPGMIMAALRVADQVTGVMYVPQFLDPRQAFTVTLQAVMSLVTPAALVVFAWILKREKAIGVAGGARTINSGSGQSLG